MEIHSAPAISLIDHTFGSATGVSPQWSTWKGFDFGFNLIKLLSVLSMEGNLLYAT